MYCGAVVFRLTQSVKNLVVEAKLQRKRSSSECLNAEVMFNTIACDNSDASIHVVDTEKIEIIAFVSSQPSWA